MRSIGIVGLRHSGKTTLAKEFLKQGPYVRKALADPLKDNAVEMCNTFLAIHGRPLITRADLEKDKGQFRLFLQFLGTEFAREYVGPDDFWIRLFEKEVQNEKRLVVCDDVRFPNEAERLRRLGFLIVKISRDEEGRQESLRAAGDTSENHASETNIPLIDADVYLNKIPHERIPEVVSFIFELDKPKEYPYPVSIWHDAPTGLILQALKADRSEISNGLRQ